jgi:hypothetical protein
LHNADGGKSDYRHQGKKFRGHKPKYFEDKHQAAVTKLRFSWESRKPVCYAKFYSRSHDAVTRVYDEAGKVLETHKQAGESSTYTTFGSTLTIIGERNVQ